ncbi:MAG: permease [Synergistaceae bacterium]|nr:permease [Synergistaceae bacterium]
MRTIIQNQLLKMDWLDALAARLLAACGIDVSGRLGGSLRFFVYDSIKILLLLCTLIFVISLIQSYFPPERSRRILSRFGGLAASLCAALLGTVTPFCSCSSIPIFIGFTAAGLPLQVTFSFLISSPMVDVGSLVLLASVFGWKISLLYVFSGLVIAVCGGAFIGFLKLENEVEEYIRSAKIFETPQAELRFSGRLDFAAEQTSATAKRLLPYVLAGVAIGAFIHNWIPEEFVVRLLGSRNPFGVILAALIGIPMYADIFGTIPIAEALLAKGALLGVVLSFMMAVTTLSLPSLVMLRKAVKPRLLAVFIAICTIGIIVSGYVFNAVQKLL